MIFLGSSSIIGYGNFTALAFGLGDSLGGETVGLTAREGILLRIGLTT